MDSAGFEDDDGGMEIEDEKEVRSVFLSQANLLVEVYNSCLF